MFDITVYLATGVFAGFLAGLFGVGGGLIIVPILYYIFAQQGFEPAMLMHLALATSLATIIITSLSSGYAHHKKKAILWPLFFALTPAILVGAWCGGVLTSYLNKLVLLSIFAVFEFLVACSFLLKKTPTTTHKNNQKNKPLIQTTKTISGGWLIGFISSLVGIGGGSLTVPFLYWQNIPIKNAIATSAACGFPIAVAGSLAYFYTSDQLNFKHAETIGFVHLYALFFIAGSSFFIAPLGAKLAHALPEKTLSISFSFLLFALSFYMWLQ